MAALESLDIQLFRFCNQTLSNGLFDVLMPLLSWDLAFPVLILLVADLLIWKGGARGRLCMVFLVVAIALADTCALIRCGASGSMPLAHATNWCAAATVCLWFYRRSLQFMLPLAVAVSFSRIYNGVHYLSDVLVGALLGMRSAAAGLWLLKTTWQAIGQRWLPFWHVRLRSVLRPEVQPSFAGLQPYRAAADAQWVRLGYVLIAALLVFRLVYIAGDTIELSEDEAYQWLWSKHLALSYYSKPPLIAYTQFLGTALWGDTEFGVRFFSPVIAAALSVLMLRFLACQGHVRAGFWLVPLAATTPLLAVGSILMTIDPLSVLFWTAAMVSGWEAVQRDSTRHWLWTGLWMGLGFLSKYTALFQWLCWIVFFALWKPARVQLRRPGPWLALLVNLVCTLPVIIWNAQHGWITATHLYERGGLDAAWQPTLRFLGEFLGVEAGVLNPVFFVAMLWAMIAFWRSQRRDPLALFLFSMGAPLFLGYTIYTLRAHVLPNWIAPAVVPLFCLMALHWNVRERAGARVVKGWLAAGLVLGLVAVVVLHDTDLVQKVAGQNLPVNLDPLRRVRGWKEGAAVVAKARTRLLAEGKPVFLIGDQYGVTGLLSFYLPEAKAGVPDHPLVYFRSTDRPINQFYFWPGYTNRTGQNAIYVRDTKRKFQVPPRLLAEFASVEDFGLFEVRYRGRVLRQLQLFACRDLR